MFDFDVCFSHPRPRLHSHCREKNVRALRVLKAKAAIK